MAEPIYYNDEDYYFAAITAQSYTLDFQRTPPPNSFPFVDHISPVLDDNQNNGIISFDDYVYDDNETCISKFPQFTTDEDGENTENVFAEETEGLQSHTSVEDSAGSDRITLSGFRRTIVDLRRIRSVYYLMLCLKDRGNHMQQQKWN